MGGKNYETFSVSCLPFLTCTFKYICNGSVVVITLITVQLTPLFPIGGILSNIILLLIRDYQQYIKDDFYTNETDKVCQIALIYLEM